MHRLTVAPGDIVLLSAKHPCPYFWHLEAPSFYWYLSDFILQQSTDLEISCFMAVLVPGGSLSISESHVRIKTENKAKQTNQNPQHYPILHTCMHTQVCQISWSWRVCEVSDMGSGNCTLVLCKSSKHSCGSLQDPQGGRFKYFKHESFESEIPPSRFVERKAFCSCRCTILRR